MAKLYRCDWCHELIDPVKGDKVTKLYVEVTDGDDGSKEKVHLCRTCRPESAGAHLDWVGYHKDDE